MKNNAYKTWLNNSLSSVFFELTSGEIVPLCLVQKLEFIAVHVIKRTSSLKGKYKLSSLLHKINIMPPLTSANLFKVKITYMDINHWGNIKTGDVYVGTKNNTVKGLRDLTIDHVQPMKQTLSKNQKDLPYISAISGLIYASGCKSDRTAVRKAILGNINYNDKAAYKGLIKELNLILRETKGLRMVASAVN